MGEIYLVNHYIPSLLLRQFAYGNQVYNYNYHTQQFGSHSIKKTFSMDHLFDSELEHKFACKLEGPFGDLLNNKLKNDNYITINRYENFLMRKFLLIQSLRSPLRMMSWEEMIKHTHTENHTSVRRFEKLKGILPDELLLIHENAHNKENYHSMLEFVMQFDDMEEMIKVLSKQKNLSDPMQIWARLLSTPMFAIWDCSECGEEFILPKITGISEMDIKDSMYKFFVMLDLLNKIKCKSGSMMDINLKRLIFSSAVMSDNYSIYPITPTRMLVMISGYFRAFFPQFDPLNRFILYKPLLDERQFQKHFFYHTRMEIFKPCVNMYNQTYHFTVRHLSAEETMKLNALMMNIEVDEFVFHDYNKIRNSLYYHGYIMKFAEGRRHDFTRYV